MKMEYLWKIKTGSNLLITGPTNAGKSRFVEKLLATPDVWEQFPRKIIYCYGIMSNTVDRLSKAMPNVILMDNLPKNLDRPLELFNPKDSNCLILDDMGSLTQNSQVFSDFISCGSHHASCTVLSLEHGIFTDTKQRRFQANHWNQIILFKNLRNSRQISILARQSGISSPPAVEQAFRAATMKPYSYLILNLHGDCPEELRMMSNVLKENEEPTYVYI